MDVLFDSIEKLATAQVNTAGMLALTAFVFGLAFLVWSWKRPSTPAANEHDTNRIMAEVFGEIIGNKLQTITSENREERLANTAILRGIVESQQRHEIAVTNGHDNVIASVNKLSETLAQKLTDQQGNVTVMTDTIGSQNEAIQQILEAIQRLDKNVEIISKRVITSQLENVKLGADLAETKKQLGIIKEDVIKLTPEPTKPETPGNNIIIEIPTKKEDTTHG